MSDRRNQTDEQMDDLVIADVNDPSAWGDPITVGPSKGPRRIRNAKHLELASKFYVLSVLHRLGADARVDVDLTVVLESGKALTVDVKPLTGPMEWPVAEFRSRAGHFLAFVWYAVPNDPTSRPRVYIVASERLSRFLADHRQETLSLDRLDAEVRALEAWELLAVPPAA